MGQQQLLLIILVTIIVGIATVIAITTFSSAADSANRDAVLQDMANIASSAHGYYMKPGFLGGGEKTFDGITFKDISFPSDGINSAGNVAQNQNGRYEIEADDQELTITAHPASDLTYRSSGVISRLLDGTGSDASTKIIGIVGPNTYRLLVPSED